MDLISVTNETREGSVNRGEGPEETQNEESNPVLLGCSRRIPVGLQHEGTKFLIWDNRGTDLLTPKSYYSVPLNIFPIIRSII